MTIISDDYLTHF